MKDKIEKIGNIIKNHLSIGESILKNLDLVQRIYHASDRISNSFNDGRKLLIFGNGGSAADSQHIAGELVGRFNLERKALDARALTVDSSIITALGNDYSFEDIFSRQVEAYASKGDVLFGISTSGTSPNVLKAFKTGRDMGTYNICLTGDKKLFSDLYKICDLVLKVPSQETPRIQEYHTLIYHTICELVEENFKK
jgi:D-sedoheptulose 7-phosphate isomerase